MPFQICDFSHFAPACDIINEDQINMGLWRIKLIVTTELVLRKVRFANNQKTE